ncbi:MAG: hypothetical protein NDI87_16185 [Rhodoferax sp.]|nr:hypothetical protein [Rhodoferax sp.]
MNEAETRVEYIDPARQQQDGAWLNARTSGASMASRKGGYRLDAASAAAPYVHWRC